MFGDVLRTVVNVTHIKINYVNDGMKAGDLTFLRPAPRPPPRLH